MSSPPPAPRSQPSRQALFWLIVTTLLWGGSFVFNKIGLRDLPPLVFMSLRFSCAAVAMGLIAGRRLIRLSTAQAWRGTLVGLALAGANTTFVFGISGTSVSRAGFLNNLFVLIIPLLCYLIWRSRIDGATLCGLALATAGLLQLAWGGGGFSSGDIFSTVCALFISLHILAVSRLLLDGDVLAITTIQFATVALVGGLAVAVFPPPPFELTTTASTALAYCIIFPTMICFTLQNTYQRYVTPTQAGLIYTLDPIWSLLGGMLFLGESLTPREWLGCILIFAAVALPYGLKFHRERLANAPHPPS